MDYDALHNSIISSFWFILFYFILFYINNWVVFLSNATPTHRLSLNGGTFSEGNIYIYIYIYIYISFIIIYLFFIFWHENIIVSWGKTTQYFEM